MVQEYGYRKYNLIKWPMWDDENMAHKYAKLGKEIPEMMRGLRGCSAVK